MIWGRLGTVNSDSRNKLHHITTLTEHCHWEARCGRAGGNVSFLKVWDTSSGNEPPPEVRCRECERRARKETAQ